LELGQAERRPSRPGGQPEINGQRTASLDDDYQEQRQEHSLRLFEEVAQSSTGQRLTDAVIRHLPLSWLELQFVPKMRMTPRLSVLRHSRNPKSH
jgi:hypothetical protein